jgi:hypothetical protein
MTTKDYVPRKESEFATWLANLVSVIAMRIGKWAIPADAFEPVQNAAAAFAIAYAIAIDPATRSSVTIVAKDDSKKDAEKKTRSFIKTYVAFNPAVSNADRTLAGLPIYKDDRTPAPIPTKSPNYSIDAALRQLTIHFYDVDRKHPAKPDGVHGAEIRWAILEAPPETIDEMVHSSFDTHTPFTLTFDENQRGKTVYMCLCWENTRGQKGPWSEIKNSNIP